MPEPLSTIVGLVKPTIDTLTTIKPLLISNPDRAALLLDEVLADLQRCYGNLDEAIDALCAVPLDNDEQLALNTLERISTGSITVEVAKADYACTKINDIYTKHLRKWLSDLVNDPHKTAELDASFDAISHSDQRFVDLLVVIESNLRVSASEIIDLWEHQQKDEARALLSGVRRELRAGRMEVSTLLTELWTLRTALRM